METYNKEKIQYDQAYERVQKIKKFYRSVLVMIIIFSAVSLYKYFQHGEIFYTEGISTLFIIWGIILAIKGVKLFLLNPQWENDMIKKELKNPGNGNF